jgi:hypothetical protein
MRLLIAIGAAAFALSACTTGTQEVASAPPGVSYRVTDASVSDANLRAERYCERYSRHAVLEGVSQSGGDRIASYSCR